MKSFPMFIRTSGRRVVIAGGGEQAAQKARLILKTDASLVLAAAELDDELADLVKTGRASQHLGPITPSLFQNAAMAFVASGCPGIDASLHAIAQGHCPVNVVDQPALCDITTPSIVDRDPVVVAIGTEGTAPVLARRIKTKLEEVLPHNLGGLAALAGRLRRSVSQSVPRARRRAFWAWVFGAGPNASWARGAEREAAAAIKAAIAAGGAPDQHTQTGSISLVGAGPGAKDLLTLRAVQRLQEADVVFFDRLVDEDVLELARRDAERVFVGKHVGANAWPQDRINAVILAEARAGRRVVRLKSGDPGIFGRGGEELEAARDAGIAVEIVPGVTAAVAAGAALGQSLTRRGATDTLILTTGMGAAEAPFPDCTRFAGPGATTAFYMSVGQAGRIERSLMAQGLPGETEVAIAADVSKPTEQTVLCRLDRLQARLAEMNCTGCAVLMVTWPKAARAVKAVA
ncbi:MAG: siroheme synthase CysG [Pseudomonadota bacterium]